MCEQPIGGTLCPKHLRQDVAPELQHAAGTSSSLEGDLLRTTLCIAKATATLTVFAMGNGRTDNRTYKIYVYNADMDEYVLMSSNESVEIGDEKLQELSMNDEHGMAALLSGVRFCRRASSVLESSEDSRVSTALLQLRADGQLYDVELLAEGEAIKVHKERTNVFSYVVVSHRDSPFLGSQFSHLECVKSRKLWKYTNREGHVHKMNIITMKKMQTTEKMICNKENGKNLQCKGHDKKRREEIVLAATIPYFRAMFAVDMLETTQHSISIPNLDRNALEKLVLFAYGYGLEVSADSVLPVMVAANFLLLEDISVKCSNFICDRLLEVSNVLRLEKLFLLMGRSSAVAKVERFVERNFVHVSSTEEFLEFSLKKVLTILRRHSIQVTSEEEVFHAALRWIEHDTQRRRLIKRVLSSVRLHLLDREFLVEIVAYHPIIEGFASCRKLLYLVGGEYRSGRGTSSVYCYDIANKTLSKLPNMTKVRKGCAAVIFENKLYAFGGRNYDSSSSVEVYDAVYNSWSECARMTQHRCMSTVVSLHGFIYVIGGQSEGQALSTVERFRPTTDRWEPVSGMASGRACCSAVVLGERIYVFGGIRSDRWIRDAESFDPKTGVWTPLKPMPFAGCTVAAVTMSGAIYILRRRYDDETYRIYRYDADIDEYVPVSRNKALS
ncbi:kelch repeat protein [Oesophagostomum dentatum]|uniref:Kelch repeat protein n=1 Tax=Oesophagostomum dentatum TaxID=61180 RepID=A0A0B1TTF9_OESDE|nr:kelch repeat protein [Oesophagostomum dentatum]